MLLKFWKLIEGSKRKSFRKTSPKDKFLLQEGLSYPETPLQE